MHDVAELGTETAFPSLEDFSRAERVLHDAMSRLRRTPLDKVQAFLEREWGRLEQPIAQGLLNYPQVYAHLLNATADKPSHRAVVESLFRAPFVPPTVIDAARFREHEPPPRKWLVEGWIPANDCTLIGADGGTGKTTIGLQLAHAMETQGLWLGMEVMAGPVLYLTAEEPEAEMHFRYRAIAAPSCNSPAEPLHIVSLADYEETALITLADGKPQATDLLGWLEDRARQMRARLIILDAVADICAINESDRNQVRRAVAILRGMAIRLDCAIVLMAHPSVDGIKTGRGYSGSTHWNNAVRSRMYFTTPASEAGEELDQDARLLSLEKANRARKGQKLTLRWQDGRFVVDETNAVEDRAALVRAKETFVSLFKTLKAQGRGERLGVNPRGGNYAPRMFEKLPDAGGIKAKMFEKAMEELFSESIIKLVSVGPVSRRIEYIALNTEIFI
jgi:RecA-family ATPase